MQRQLGDEWSKFVQEHSAPAPVSILLNTSKLPESPFPDTTVVPWCEHGVYLDERPVFALDPLYHAGAYYVMEPSSMLLSDVLDQLLPAEGPLRILDLCAAPGGKTMVLTSKLREGDLLLSNEVNKKRVGILRENVARWGSSQVWTSNADPSRIKTEGYFDCVLVDAPCSGEGLFRKDPTAMNEWSPKAVNHCSARQNRILLEATRLVKPGGHLIYSTCTYAEEENAARLNNSIDHRKFEFVPLNLDKKYAVVKCIAGPALGYQCYPHKIKGEGFFVAAVRRKSDITATASHKTRRAKKQRHSDSPGVIKPSDEIGNYVDLSGLMLHSFTHQVIIGIQEEYQEDLATLITGVPGLRAGIKLGMQKGRNFVPSQELAWSTRLKQEAPRVILTKEQAMGYLRREQISVDTGSTGWVVAEYADVTLGWMKVLKDRLVKNHYPISYRLRM